METTFLDVNNSFESLNVKIFENIIDNIKNNRMFTNIFNNILYNIMQFYIELSYKNSVLYNTH